MERLSENLPVGGSLAGRGQVGDAAEGRATPGFLPGDYYLERGLLVFTAQYLERRGWCCGNGCRHCPYGKAE